MRELSTKEITLNFRVHRSMLLNANVQRHRFDKSNRAKKLRELGKQTGEECTQKECSFFNKFTIDVLVYPPTKRRFDPPNLSPTTKHIIDGLTDAGLWVDDDWSHLTKISFAYGGHTSGEKDVFIFDLIIKEQD